MNILVIGDHETQLQRAKRIFISRRFHRFEFTSSAWLNPFLEWKYITDTFDMVFSLHCKVIFPKLLFERVRCVNIHPGYNPHNKGMFPHVWSMVNGKPAGVTIHEITEKIDGGPIICQSLVPIKNYDTSASLYERVLDAELELLENNLDRIIDGEYQLLEPGEGNYNSWADFKRLCDLDPEKVGTFQEFYDLMRALSHNDFKNAHLNGNYFKLSMI